ncbi:MAG: hypothetical protein WBL74_00225 [Novosphingobium sp.]|uniref:hypothetical protein n=1 Tax=Novosphingobium sp. TaxID=1874826 RepID=UPI003C7C9303
MTHNSLKPAGGFASGLSRYAVQGVIGLGAIFVAGVFTGLLVRMAERGTFDAKGVLIAAGLLALFAVLGWIMVRLYKAHGLPRSEPIGPSERKIRSIWMFTFSIGAIGGALSLLLARPLGFDSASGMIDALFSNAPMPPLLAALLLALLACTTAITIAYYRLIDEHEVAAQQYASNVSFNAYALIMVAWWLAAKGGFAAPLDAGAVFAITMAVWMVVWLWRRYR